MLCPLFVVTCANDDPVHCRINVWPGLNTLKPRQNGRFFADDIFKCIFLNENAWISLKSSLKFVPQVRINNIPALVQIMAWRHPGDKPLSEPMMVCLLTHICVTRPQWVNELSGVTFSCFVCYARLHIIVLYRIIKNNMITSRWTSCGLRTV